MKFIKSNYTIIEQEDTLKGIYKQIELAGRACYKSEDKITDTSSEEFVNRMIASKHYAMLEHGTVYLYMKIPLSSVILGYGDNYMLYKFYTSNAYSFTNEVINKDKDYIELYITTNYRVLIENSNLDLNYLKYICKYTKNHEKRVCVKFICDRGISHEFVRHRVFSFAQESTRYCNYGKNKFGNELTFIAPIDNMYDEEFKEDFDLNSLEIIKLKPAWKQWYNALLEIENCYLDFVDPGMYKILPQISRSILPNCLKTELIMTGFISDWEHFFKLRNASTAHPQARELAEPLHNEFKQLYNIK